MTNRTCAWVSLLCGGGGFLAALLLFPARAPVGGPAEAGIPATAAPPSRVAGVPPVARPNRVAWAGLESTNYAGYIANLRVAGCPEQTIRDIVVADICLLYREQWRQRFGNPSAAYWSPAFGRATPVTEEQLREAAAMRGALRENVWTLLGVDLDVELAKFGDFAHDPPDLALLLRGSVREELVPVVAAAYERHRRCRDLVEQSGPITSEGIRALQRSRDSVRDELRRRLSPAEFQEVEFRCSDAAFEIRELLQGFPLAPAEFASLHQLRTTAFEAVAAAVAAVPEPADPDTLLTILAAQELDEARIATVLGPERFAEYERTRDLRYQEMQRVGEENSVPPDWVARLYDQERQEAGRVAAIQQDPELTSAGRESALREAEAARQVRLAELLGPELAAKFSVLAPGNP